MTDKVRLDEYDKEEWWDVARVVAAGRNPPYTREEFDKAWDEFQQLKAEHERKKALN